MNRCYLNTISLLFLQLGLIFGQSTVANAQGTANLIFEDNFNTGTLDATKWTIGYHDPDSGDVVPGARDQFLLNNKYAGYITADDVQLQNGSLHLLNQQRNFLGNNGVTYSYTSGQVMSLHKFFFNKGYVEWRAKFPTGKSMWPALWLIAEDLVWGPEWDAFEYFGTRSSINAEDVMGMHLATGAWPNVNWNSHWEYDFDATYDNEAWHVYGFEWTATEANWYIDGQLVHTLPNTLGAAWPNEDMYIVMNNGILSSVAGDPADFPNSLTIDYVRVWDSKPLGDFNGLASFSSDFDSLIPAPTGDPIGDGWLFHNTNGPDPDYFGDAPNGPQISSLADDGAGNQYLNVFADYGNPNLATNALTLRVFQEQTFTAADAALEATRTFRFDYAKADDPFGVGGATTTGAFIRVLDDSLNLLDEAVFDTTGATGPVFAPGSVSLTFDPAWTTGGIVQFGFTSTVIGSDPSGVYYDNVNFFVLGDANDDGVLDFNDVTPMILALFDRTTYLFQFPGVDPDVVLDMNNDGVLDFLDVSGFLAALGF